MPLETLIVLSVLIYKLTSLAVGLSSLYMGYRLFISGIWGQAGDVDVKFQDSHLLVRRAAPGTFFALLGTIIVCATLFKGLDFNSSSQSIAPEVTTSQDVRLPETAPISGETK